MEEARVAGKKQRLKLQKNEVVIGSLFLLPSLGGVLLFFLIPFVGGFYYAVVDHPLFGHFVGLENFINILQNQAFLKAAVNTSIFTAIGVPFNMVLALILALLLKQAGKTGKMMLVFFILPLVIPVASVSYFWQIVFAPNGWLNNLFYTYGMSTIDWLNTGWARMVILIVYLWKYVGYNIVLYLFALSSIPAEYYEAADIDGANGWQKFRHITLIYLTPAIFFVFIISMINSLKVFRETYLIAGQYPHESIYMLQHYMNNMFLSLDYQKLTSAAYLMVLFITMLVFLFFYYQKKITSRFTP